MDESSCEGKQPIHQATMNQVAVSMEEEEYAGDAGTESGREG